MTQKISSVGVDPRDGPREGSGPGAAWDLAEFFGSARPAEWSGLSADAETRLARLALASPLYARMLQQNPAWALWLEEERNLRTDYRYQAVVDEWRAFSSASGVALADEDGYLDLLRRWRRLMSLRIAYRSVNQWASELTTVQELTRLAEFCLREVYFLAVKRWTARYGEPWDDVLHRPARFAILGMGKMGGQELNFSSDIDLLFLYEGDGSCRSREVAPSFSSVEFFTKVAETVIRNLSAQTEAGFLFRVDVRLRPEGAAGPLVRSLASLEAYYAAAGQTWERLSLLKARAVAGDLALGTELLENLQSFRYPRHPPPSLLAEVAAMKGRTEREIVGPDALESDVKSGHGGIREIEFIVQSFQLLQAGRYPFLQTHSTQSALDQLVRYGLMPAEESAFLSHAYWFLRTVEHRIQMREEQQTHALPASDEARRSLARSLGFEDLAAFERKLNEVRSGVRRIYADLFSEAADADRGLEDWWAFFTSGATLPLVQRQLARWFGPVTDAASALRLFVCGDGSHLVTREQVVKFQHLSPAFDRLMPRLARPGVTLHRLSRFAERYGSRSQFFSACAGNPEFCHVLALLFDRSTFLHELLCAHPEIFEEILRPEILRQRKDRAVFAREFSAGPADTPDFAAWLPLYLRAEQVRYAVAQLLGFTSRVETEQALTRLADATFEEIARREPDLRRVLVVALGKYGGEELTLGSDLDVVFLADESDVPELEPLLRRSLRLLAGRDGLGQPFTVDTRLRPYGEAGPLISTLSAFRKYHEGSAQAWERQMLTRARAVAGPDRLRQDWESWREALLYQRALNPEARDALWRMRLRIEKERDVTTPPERAFKTGAGGLIDHEFLAQILALTHGWQHPGLRSANTPALLAELARLQQIPQATSDALLENYEFLKRLEFALRFDENRPVSILPADTTALAHWLGFPSVETFWSEHRRRLNQTRASVVALLYPPAAGPSVQNRG